MADVSKINLYGTEYDIKDNTARTSATEAKTAAVTAQNEANEATKKANANSANITKLSTEGIVIAYESKNESINVTKGITVS